MRRVLSALGALTIIGCSAVPPAAPPPAPPPPPAPVVPAIPWAALPKTMGLRTVIEGPLLINPDGTSSLPSATDVVRVSDHYSACFVTRAGEVACWGVATGGTWNGVATRDPAVGLKDVVDIAIDQTKACALTREGRVSCWTGSVAPQVQDLPRAAREIAHSISGRACALLTDGTVASTRDWTSGGWERVMTHGAPLSDVAHLAVCDRGVVCGELAHGGVACATSEDAPGAPDTRTGVRSGQQALLTTLSDHPVPPGMHVSMNDYATAYCAYASDEVRCFDAATRVTQTIHALRGVKEVALGATRLAGADTSSAACARVEGDAVRCWNLADAEPKLIDPLVHAPVAAVRPAEGGPRVRVGAVTVTGALPPEVVQRLLREKGPFLRACYEHVLAKNPSVQGRVTIKAVIDNKGKVVKATPTRRASDTSPPLDDAAVKCAVTAVKQTELPPEEGGATTVSVPMVFEASR